MNIAIPNQQERQFFGLVSALPDPETKKPIDVVTLQSWQDFASATHDTRAADTKNLMGAIVNSKRGARFTIIDYSVSETTTLNYRAQHTGLRVEPLPELIEGLSKKGGEGIIRLGVGRGHNTSIARLALLHAQLLFEGAYQG